MVVKLLGEALARLPSGHPDGSNAGASFGLTRHVTLPGADSIAFAVVKERADELAAVATALAREDSAPSQLVTAAANLNTLAQSFAAGK